MNERIRLGLVGVLLLLQLGAGVLGFGLSPEGAFPQVVDQPVGATALRLAAYGNLAQVVTTVALLALLPGVRTVRIVALGHVVYHVLAGGEAVRGLIGTVPVEVLPHPAAPVVVHGLAACLAVFALALPAQSKR